jgi:hypothetical protein
MLSSLNQGAESDYMYSDDSESIYISKSQFYFLRMNNQNISKYFKKFQIIQELTQFKNSILDVFLKINENIKNFHSF